MNGKHGQTFSLNLKIFLILLMVAAGGIVFGVHIMSIIRKDYNEIAVETGLSGSAPGRTAGQPVTAPRIKHHLHQVEISGFVLLSLLLAMPLVAAWLIYSWISRPINAMTRVTAKMIDGHLNETVSCAKHAEIGRLGALINAFSINYQEILLFIWKQAGESTTLADDIINRLREQSDGGTGYDLIAEIESMRHCIDQIRSMIESFGLYDILLDGNEILMGNNNPARPADAQ